MKLKRGYVREDGMIFLRYRPSKALSNYGNNVEVWITREKMDETLSQRRIAANQFYKRDPGKMIARSKAYRDKNLDSCKARSSRYYRENREKWIESENKKREKRALSLPEERNAWILKRLSAKTTKAVRGPKQRLPRNVRQRIRDVIIGRMSKTNEYIGCDWKTLIEHLESKFQDGMTWDNYGLHGWHVDHRIPIASAKTPEELIPLLHFSNLQPLWAFDNLAKGGRIPLT